MKSLAVAVNCMAFLVITALENSSSSIIVDQIAKLSFSDLHESLVNESFQNSNHFYPTSLDSHQTKSLNGVYDFCVDSQNEGLKSKWYKGRLMSECPPKSLYRMPVPTAFNDILEPLRDYVGWIWYETRFKFAEANCTSYSVEPSLDVPSGLKLDASNYLRFDSVNYLGLIWLDGSFLGSHIGGHLPFGFDVTKELCSPQALPTSGKSHKLTVAVSNELSYETIPTGKVVDLRAKVGRDFRKLEPNFDFFHYAGILGDIQLVSLPIAYVKRVHLTSTSIEWIEKQRSSNGSAQIAKSAELSFKVNLSKNSSHFSYSKQTQCDLSFEVEDPSGVIVAQKVEPMFEYAMFGTADLAAMRQVQVTFRLDAPQLWSPANFPSNKDIDKQVLNYRAALYKLRVKFRVSFGNKLALVDVDTFELKFGIREFKLVSTTGKKPAELRKSNASIHDVCKQAGYQLTKPSDSSCKTLFPPQTRYVEFNKRRIKLLGFGSHHEQAPSGRTMTLAAIQRDMNMLKSLGANTLRTSHYPYSERFLDLADENGVLIIAETPAVGLTFDSQDEKATDFSATQLKLHKIMLREMFDRDASRASVIMWSLANEPQSQKPQAEAYFKNLTSFARTELGEFTTQIHKPLTVALAQSHLDDKVGQFLDVLMINRYYGWYEDGGVLDAIAVPLKDSLNGWATKYNKPLLVSEFGAEALVGFHSKPSREFSEEYQSELLSLHHDVFDELYSTKINLLGELVWNYADFNTHQSVSRVFGNHKGILTAERQPKAAAKVVAARYLRLSRENLDQYAKPNPDFEC